MNHCWSTIINHYESPLTTVNHHEPLVIYHSPTPPPWNVAPNLRTKMLRRKEAEATEAHVWVPVSSRMWRLVLVEVNNTGDSRGFWLWWLIWFE